MSDVSGDGLVDAIAYSSPTQSFYVATSTKTSFNQYVLWPTNMVNPLGVNAGQFRFGDVNHDGRADLVGKSGVHWYVALSTGTGFATATEWRNGGPSGNAMLIADVTGGGNADAIVPASSNTWQVATSNGTSFAAFTGWSIDASKANGKLTNIYAADVTGDTRADIVFCQDNGDWWVAPSTGTGFGPLTRWITGLVPPTGGRATVQLGDVNADGRADAATAIGGTWKVALSTGSSFATPIVWAQGLVDASQLINANGESFLGDANGDGRADALVDAASGYAGGSHKWWVGPSTVGIDEIKAPGSPWSLQFGDEFMGDTLNSANWNNQREDWFTGGHPYGIEGAWYKPENTTVTDGFLNQTVSQLTSPIVTADGQWNYATGMVNTNHRFEFKYGYLEARIKVPSCTGCFPAFWLLPSPIVSPYRPPEVDVFEFSPDPAQIYPYFTSYWKVPNPDGTYSTNTDGTWVEAKAQTPVTTGGPYLDNWRTYGLLWTPEAVQFFVDDKPGPRYDKLAPPQQMMWVIIQAATAAGSTTTNGKTLQTDWVHIYQKPPWTHQP